MQLCGWIEENGHLLTPAEIENITPERLSRCGGEFCLSTDHLTARDRYGIMPGGTPSGIIRIGGQVIPIMPDVPDLSLEDAIRDAVRLRCDGRRESAVVALSGGVDSTLIAVLADLPCIVVGLAGFHDLEAATDAADRLDLSLTTYEITEADLEEALPLLRAALPDTARMNLEIGLAGYFIGKAAARCGAKQVLTGQAADELFGGYARYGRSQNLRADLDVDFRGLAAQRARDSVAAGLSGVWYSMPYMDERVVLASHKFAAGELVNGDWRKIALRKVAEMYLLDDLAWKPKKAMQYGSGVTAVLRRFAKKNSAGLALAGTPHVRADCRDRNCP
ncbi:MAG: asparagine synthase C-terminal domain-containing protein [Methanocalculaceae archaeon]|jgi:asparagine synthase (glutamine-hydrolysing)|nr:asparagine synthase C-terminal domain-containing protein [Methanocalculaceae archaeon]